MCHSLCIVQVFGGAILQQTIVVEFIVNGQMCDDCRRREAKDFWRAVVQVRQKVPMCVLAETTVTSALIVFSQSLLASVS